MRWSGILLGVCLVTLLLLALTSIYTLSHLEMPFVKKTLTGYLHENYKIDLSYRTLNAWPVSTVGARALSVATPGAMAKLAPTLLEIGSIDLQWDPAATWAGLPTVRKVALSDVSITLVMDENGVTSFDPLLGEKSKTEPEAPATPVSHLLELLPASFQIDDLALSGVHLTLFQLKNGIVARKSELSGLEMRGSIGPGTDGRPALKLQLESPGSPAVTRVLVEETVDGAPKQRELTAGLKAGLEAGAQKAGIELHVGSVRQSFVTTPLPDGPIIDVVASASFQPDQNRVQVAFKQLEVLHDAVTGVVNLELNDAPEGRFKPILRSGDLQAKYEPLKPFVLLPAGLELSEPALTMSMKDLELDADSYQPIRGELKAHLVAGRLSQVSEGTTLEMERAVAALNATFAGPLKLSLTGGVKAGRLRYAAGTTDVAVEEASLDIDARDLAIATEKLVTSTGRLAFQLKGRRAEGRLDSYRLSGGDLEAKLETVLTGAPPYALNASMGAPSLVLRDRRGRLVADLSGARLEANADKLVVNEKDSARSAGRFDARLKIGPLSANARGEQDSSGLRYQADARASTLKPLAPLLEPFLPADTKLAWQRLGFSARSQGTIRGLGGSAAIALDQKGRIEATGVSLRQPDLELDTRTIRVDAGFHGTAASNKFDLDMDLAGLRYRSGDLRVSAGKASGKAEGALKQGGIEASLDLELPALEVLSGVERVELETSRHRVSLKSKGALADSEVAVVWQSSVAKLIQSYEPLYPSADVRIASRLRVARLTAVQVDKFTLESAGAATRLDLTAVMDQAPHANTVADKPDQPDDSPVVQIPGGRGVAINGVLKQGLEPLSATPETFSGRGTVSIPFRIESPDHALFRVTSTLQFQNVDLKLPRQPLTVSGLTGKFLVEEELLYGDDGLTVLPNDDRNAYTRASFPDTQPFLTGDSYFSMEKLLAQDLEAGPVAGNLRVDHNTLRLDQLQMGMKEGTVTGQLLVDYVKGNSRVLFRGNANGLKLSKSRERLDANLALAFALEKLDLNGQAHLVRIGRQTLLELIDTWDPYHEDATFNKVREALKIGYPKFVRLSFDHGFMSARIVLGGAAAAIRIDEVRGIPMGTLMNRYVGPYLPR